MSRLRQTNQQKRGKQLPATGTQASYYGEGGGTKKKSNPKKKSHNPGSHY